MGQLHLSVRTRGFAGELDAYVTSLAFDRTGRNVAFGLGDGSAAVANLARQQWTRREIHAGGVLAMATDLMDGSFISAGDDGQLRRFDSEHAIVLYDGGGKWIEHVAVHDSGKGGGTIACGIGRTVLMLDRAGAVMRRLDHESTVSGLVFDGKGKRLCASHYNGASLWFVSAVSGSARKLIWKGSHIAIAIHPGARQS